MMPCLKQSLASSDEKKNVIRRIRLEDAWGFEKNLLIATGYYPKVKKSIFYWLRYILVTFFSLGQLTAMFVQLALETDLTKIIDTLYFCMTETAYLCKLFNFGYNRNNFRKIEDFAAHPTFNRHSIEQDALLSGPIATCVTIAKSYRLLCLLVIFLLSLYPVLDQSSVKLLPLAGWYPIDKERYYWVVYTFQVVALWISAAMNSCFDTLASACICVGAIQFDVLMENFKVEINQESDSANRDKRRKDISKIICTNVVHHNDIFRYIALIESTFSNGIFVQFLASIIVICMTGFQMLVVSPTSVQFLSLISYLSCMMNQVALYCWYGNDILLKSSIVGKASYMSDWYQYDLKDQKSLFIIMERSKRPVKLTAAKFFTLSLDTLMMILRSSYSYFAVLRHLYSENEGLHRQ